MLIRNVFISFHVIIRNVRTLCRDRQKRLVFVHLFHTQHLVRKHFSKNVCVRKYQLFTYTLLHTIYTNISYTQIQNTKCLRKETVDILSLASTFGWSRRKTYKSYFRIILVNGFLEHVSYFEMFLFIPDNTGKWFSGIVLSRTEMIFDFLYPRINIKKTTAIYCKMKGKIDLFSHPLHFLCGCEKKKHKKVHIIYFLIQKKNIKYRSFAFFLFYVVFLCFIYFDTTKLGRNAAASYTSSRKCMAICRPIYVSY